MAEIHSADGLAYESEAERARFMKEEGLPLLSLYRSIRDPDLRSAVTVVLQSIVDADIRQSRARRRP